MGTMFLIFVGSWGFFLNIGVVVMLVKSDILIFKVISGEEKLCSSKILTVCTL